MKLVVNVRHSNYDVYVGRGSIWGNPYSDNPNSKARYIVKTRKESIECYCDHIFE